MPRILSRVLSADATADTGGAPGSLGRLPIRKAAVKSDRLMSLVTLPGLVPFKIGAVRSPYLGIREWPTHWECGRLNELNPGLFGKRGLFPTKWEAETRPNR